MSNLQDLSGSSGTGCEPSSPGIYQYLLKMLTKIFRDDKILLN